MKAPLAILLIFWGAWHTALAGDKITIRVGHFANITHAQALIGHGLTAQGKGWFEQRLGDDVRVEWLTYSAGPSAMEALLTKSLDLAYVGPSPTINAHLRAKGKEVRIIAGACSGGAALIVQPDGRIRTDADFKGKKIATPQLGNTQDVAARAWLRSKGFRVTMTGGDALVVPTSNPDQLLLFQKRDIDAVWTVEPWVSRLVLQVKGKIYLEESALWTNTGGKYVTTHLVSSMRFLSEKPDLLRKWIQAHVELTDWINKHPEEAKRLVNDELRRLTTRPIPEEVLGSAWNRLELTYDPVRSSLLKSAEDAFQIGFIRHKPDLSKIYDLSLLNSVLREKGAPELP